MEEWQLLALAGKKIEAAVKLKEWYDAERAKHMPFLAVQNESPVDAGMRVSGSQTAPVVDSDDEAQTRYGIGLRDD